MYFSTKFRENIMFGGWIIGENQGSIWTDSPGRLRAGEHQTPENHCGRQSVDEREASSS